MGAVVENGDIYEIRVLDVLPMDADQGDATPIECKTRKITITEHGASEAYEAVSYTWTKETHRVKILLSGVETEVTPHLAAAIRRLRLKDRSRTLWIDQLCIKQNDAKEKTQQVQVMRYIYSHCTSCVVWWGEIPFADKGIHLADAEAAFDLISYMSAAHRSTDQNEIDDPKHLPKWLQEAAATMNGPLTAHPRVTRAMLALECIAASGNPWWKRVWTVQEAILPKMGCFLWGPLELGWATLTKATYVYNGSQGTWPSLIGSLYSASRRNQKVFTELMVNQIWLNNSRFPTAAVNVIKKWRGRKATEPRDNIYGLMGLISNDLPSMQICDYELSLPEVYGALSADLIVSEQSLLPLIMDPRLEPGTGTPGLPRWAMDMKTYPRYDTNWCPMYSYEYYNADAGLGQQDWQRFRKQARADKHSRLTLQGGLLLDVVKEPIETFTFLEDIQLEHDIALQSILQTMLNHNQFVEQTDDGRFVGYSTDEAKYLYAFGRLVLGDFIRHLGEQSVARPANSQDVQEIHRYIETGEIDPVHRSTALKVLKSQAFFSTQKRRFIGVGQREVQHGDEVWLFPGGRMPLVLRPRSGSTNGTEVEKDFVGRCYIQGIMQGEALKDGYVKIQDKKVVRIY